MPQPITSTPQAPQVDSLALPKVDYSTAYPYPVYSTEDSLRVRFSQDEASMQQVAPEAVFGTASVRVQPPAVTPHKVDPIAGDALFQGLVLLLATTYALLLYRNLTDVRLLLNRIIHDSASGKRLYDDPAGNGFIRFMNITTILGLLLCGVLVAKYAGLLLPGNLIASIPGAALGVSLLATCACGGMALYQVILIRISGAIVLAQSFTSQLQVLRLTYFSLFVVITTPTMLLYALCPQTTAKIWFTLIIIEFAVTFILYLRETLNLFISKKVSILHWFLYLCAVEIFPVSLIWLLAIR